MGAICSSLAWEFGISAGISHVGNAARIGHTCTILSSS